MRGVMGILLFLIFMSSNLYSVFDHIDWGSKAVGVGFGYVSYDGEGLGLFWNPASIGSIYGKEVNSMVAIPFVGIKEIEMRYMLGNFVMNLSEYGVAGVGFGIFDVSDVWCESMYVVGYGRKIFDNFLIGGVVKYMEFKILLSDNENEDPLLKKKQRLTFSIDLGAIYKVRENLNFGVTMKDVIEPKITDSSEKVSRGYLLGANYKFSMMPDADFIVSVGNYMYNRENDYSFGIELLLKNGKIGLRSCYLPYRFAVGCSYSLGKVRIDYTYVIPFQINSNSHYFSILLRI